ncbi:cysteine synthase CysM [Tatumella ptyseos]|uniref:cysteine synthase CysM n=1 Tax=Tatumella ptyseos TaxID=82987 RepID=UPI0026E985DC|nr:cysteine synthase CysM [Tatumella ptyseos]WKX25618.1 cysteine synthase CysM [Tatumella ptyseos]
MTTLESTIGNTPLVKLQRLPSAGAGEVWVKLEGNNPAGSVKDRAAWSMVRKAEQRGLIKPGDTLIEATSGNTGIALAMICAVLGYKLKLLMPDNMSTERQAAMQAYGAELILVDQAQGMEYARDYAQILAAQGVGIVLDQFNNPDNALAHYQTTGPEIWQQTEGRITHFVSSMGTTGTISGTGRYLKQQNTAIQVVGLQPEAGSQIAGIRHWQEAYQPTIYQPQWVDDIVMMTQERAENSTRALAQQEGIFCGISSGAAVSAALSLADAHPERVVVAIVCDRGDRYLSTGVFNGTAVKA